jgi:hypothetical protein
MKKIIAVFMGMVLSTSLLYSNQQATFLESSNNEYQIFLLGYFMLMIITMFKGYGDKRTVIIFRDYNDLGLTFLIPASVYLVFILFTSFGGNQKLALLLAFGVGFVLFGILAKNTYIDNNRSMLRAILVIMTKMPLGILWFLNFITMLNPSGKTATQRRKNRGAALIILAILTPLIGVLVVNKEGSLFNPKDWIRGKRIGNMRDHL